MLQQVNAGNKSLADYRSIVPRELYEELQDLSERLKGIRVLHVNATASVEALRRFYTPSCRSCVTRASRRSGM